MDRMKFTATAALLLNVINLMIYSLVLVAIVFKCFDAKFSDITICIYGGLMAFGLMFHEFKQLQIVMHYFQFICLHFGRGLIIILFGCMVLDTKVINVLTGIVCLACGCVYVVLHFVPDFPPPNTLLNNWQHWCAFRLDQDIEMLHPPPYSPKARPCYQPFLN
ncbi:hypothetical protein DM01DRAFT_1194325 [Hesseltinella vesiculosa]|uniref:COPI associated n=1 Tax=Hesseltinella vesiculosa TaxID=101127 RepID=A0A1X2G3W2_9FUNG|nr:hypothetical protein DM01DRAFT_1194325 [Hesseltinella vesiculosa]